MKEQKSFYFKPADVKREWILIDATDQVLGRLASHIAQLVRGKLKPTYTPSVDSGDFVIVLNTDKLKFTGNKLKDKMYYRHTGYPGGLKSISLKDQMKKDSTAVLYEAVKGMLPGTKLGKHILKKVKIFRGAEHPHSSQQPKVLETLVKEA